MNTNSRENNSARNAIIGFVNHMLMMILLFATKTVFLKTIGIGYAGISGVFVNVFIILSILEYGVGTVYIYALYKPIAENDEAKVAIIYHLFKKIYIILTSVVFTLGLMVIPFLSLLIDIDLDIKKIILYYIFYLSTTTITNLFLYNPQLIVADQKESIRSLYLTLTESISFILQIIILILTKNFSLYLAIALIKSIVFNIFIARKTKELYPFLKNKQHDRNIDLKEKHVIYKKIKDSCIYRFGWVVLTSADNIIITVMIGTIWVGYYGNYKLIIMGVAGIINVLYSAVSASVGNLLAIEDEISQHKVFQVMQVIDIWLAAFTSTCLIVLTQHFITLWIGSQYLLDIKILIIIVFNFYLNSFRKSVVIFLQGYGKYNRIRRVMIIAALSNIILSIILGKLLGVFGVLLATTIVILSTYYWFEVKFLYNEIFKKSVKEYFIKNLQSLSFTTLCIVTTYLITYKLDSSTISSFMLKVLVCFALPNILFFIIYKNKPSTKVVFDILFRRLRLFLNRRENE